MKKDTSKKTEVQQIDWLFWKKMNGQSAAWNLQQTAFWKAGTQMTKNADGDVNNVLRST